MSDHPEVLAQADPAPALPGMVTPTLEQLQHWTSILGLAQQMVLERAADLAAKPVPASPPGAATVEKIAQIQLESAQKGFAIWQNLWSGLAPGVPWTDREEAKTEGDRRFADPRWHDLPIFSLIRQSYLLVSDAMLRMADSVDGLDPRQKEQMRFATRNLLDAISPTNFPFTNPQVVEKTIETNGANLLIGLERILADLDRGQLSQTDTRAFRLGENIAATKGKVVLRTPLFELIQYAPTTPSVYETPIVIFPPWINRFYILDLAPETSFVRWAVDQGFTVFMVSWKSADASLADVRWDDYVVRGQVLAIDTVRDLLGVESVHAIGYCVAGTTLAATLAWLDAQGRQDIVKSATFFTAQVDFTDAGDLRLFVDDQQLQLVDLLTANGYLDGRYLAATFNALRGQDLIWSYVVNNYLLAEDYRPFDLLFWNGDSTNLPAKWLRAYLQDLYRDNKLVQPGCLEIEGVPLDLRRVKVPTFIQAGILDHISPARSVWKAMHQFSGPNTFLLAGSGHIAGVVNPPAKRKYGYWTCAEPVATLDEFQAKATETAGSWWPYWVGWLAEQAPKKIRAVKARRPGGGALPALEDAPGSYVRQR